MRTGDFLAGLLVGTLVGATLGLLFAPEPGEETRARVKSGARKGWDTVSDKTRSVLHRQEEEAAEEE